MIVEIVKPWSWLVGCLLLQESSFLLLQPSALNLLYYSKGAKYDKAHNYCEVSNREEILFSGIFTLNFVMAYSLVSKVGLVNFTQKQNRILWYFKLLHILMY